MVGPTKADLEQSLKLKEAELAQMIERSQNRFELPIAEQAKITSDLSRLRMEVQRLQFEIDMYGRIL